MAAGLLELSGTVDLSQFWPKGTSDADTAKILVSIGPGAFRFRPHVGAPFAVTHVFDGAKVKGKTTKEVVDKKGRITVRLQGIDAPELHYMPQALLKVKDQSKTQRKLFLEWNHELRQHLGETAAAALGTRLAAFGQDPLPCRVTTAVDHPNDAFDTYGRLVGDVVVRDAGHDLNINTWVLANSWAFPAFYNSMSAEEIRRLLAVAQQASGGSGKKGVWKILKKAIGKLDFSLRAPKKGEPLDPNDAKPPVIMPKLFRRQVNFEVNRKAKMAAGSYETFLVDHPDRCYLRDDFLLQGPTAATPHRLNEFVTNGRFTLSPGDLVFREDPSTLIVPGGGTPQW